MMPPTMTLHDLPEAPRGSLLAEIAAREAAFTDAYALQLPRPVSLAAFVQAF